VRDSAIVKGTRATKAARIAVDLHARPPPWSWGWTRADGSICTATVATPAYRS